MPIRPTRVTRVDLQADRLIESAGTIIVSGIVIANNHTAPVSIEFQDSDSTAILTITVPAQSSEMCEVEFVATKGFKIDALASNGDVVFVTVFHSAVGA